MFYLRFTKVIINYFMSQDQSIPRRNKVDWYMANDDPILTTMRFIPQHEVVQRYGAILLDYLTNPAMKDSEAYKIYHDLATGKVRDILIDKMESNKSIHRSNEQKNLYKALMIRIKMKNPSVGSNGVKKRRAGKEPELTSAPKERTTKTIGKSTDGSKSQHKSAGEDKDLEELAHQEFDIGATEEQSDEDTSQHPDWFQKPAKPPTSDRDWNKTLPVVHGPVQIYGHINLDCRLVQHNLEESARDVYSKRRIIDVTKLQIIEWHGYKHLDWITGRWTNLNVRSVSFGCLSENVYRSIVIQRRVKDLQLGVKSYQKKLNITKPDTYRSDLKRRDAYTAYSNPRGFIYQNKDKKNKLMRIDELHKFSNGTLDDVRTALNDRLKGIRIEYLPKTICR
ncbi:hypothetical protein Tco_0713442 [Tanacetum coccineum]